MRAPHSRPAALAAFCALLLPLAGCASAFAVGRSAPPEPVKMTAFESAVLAESNAARKQAGLPPLVADAQLMAIARMRSKDMVTQGYFAHVSPKGGDVFTAMRHYRVLFAAAGENLARNDYPTGQSPKVAVQGWLKSPAHRENLLHPAFAKVGVGMALGSDGQRYVTEIYTD